MAQVITFENYRPSPRYDATAWTHATLEEGATDAGPWTVIDTFTWTPADTDPINPAARNFTTELASDTADLWYRITFLDATGDDSQPTTPVQNSNPSPQLYITRAEMKTALQMSGSTYADAEMDRACSAVSRAIDSAVRGTGNHFYQATETRYYTPDSTNYSCIGGEHRLEINDLVSASSVTVDMDGNGSYETTWVEGTDFFLDPANAAADGCAYEELVLRITGGRWFPRVQRAIKITGVFGWPAVPPEVSQYAQIFAAQQVLRARQAPFGVLMAGIEVGTSARISRFDPDFNRLLGDFVRTKLFI